MSELLKDLRKLLHQDSRDFLWGIAETPGLELVATAIGIQAKPEDVRDAAIALRAVAERLDVVLAELEGE